ncbi:hypothetical protein ACFPK1_14000 [Actinomycetospora rhizophila]|uniref:Uncharacterized protein n=1 Tax=Actinomycetospora rhizophila TaxID=1416876 RepID=A0ABV9ZGE1_9PSEU
MSYAAPLEAAPGAARGVRRAGRTLVSVLLTGLLAGIFLVLLETAVAEPDPRRTAGELLLPGAPEATPVLPLPYGGALQRPPGPDDLLGPGGLLGLGLLVLGLANGLVFLTTATWDGMAAPSPAETRRRLSTRSDPGVVPGGAREVRRTVPLRATAPAASAGPALEDGTALRSVPGRPLPGTTYAPFPRPGTAWREYVPPPEPARDPAPAPAPTPALEADPAPEPVLEAPVPLDPVTELDPVVPEAPAVPAVPAAPRRPSPVPRDGGDGPKRATRRGSGPWGWRPARPDPVPWRNPVPALAH